MPFLKNITRFFSGIIFSFITIYIIFFIFKYGDFEEYIFFAVPFVISLILYFLDNKLTGNVKKSPYLLSVLFYFIICFSLLFYALAHIGPIHF